MAEFYKAYRDVLIDLGFRDRRPALDAHVNRRATVESVRVLLERTGFTFVETITGTFRERFADGLALLRHYFMRLGFVPGWKEVAPEGAMERTFAALEQRLNALAADQEGLSLTIPLACLHAKASR